MAALTCAPIGAPEATIVVSTNTTRGGVAAWLRGRVTNATHKDPFSHFAMLWALARAAAGSQIRPPWAGSCVRPCSHEIAFGVFESSTRTDVLPSRCRPPRPLTLARQESALSSALRSIARSTPMPS